MELPIYDYCWDANTLKPGKRYRLPFKFVVPEELPIHACQHQCANHQIQQEHLQLPASLSYHCTQYHKIHDMSPEMAEVVYSINFELRQRNGKAGRPKKIQEATHPVHILPTRDEHPPILIPRKMSRKVVIHWVTATFTWQTRCLLCSTTSHLVAKFLANEYRRVNFCED
ncbi:unnamed protein product [Penicillium discolor]